MAKNKAIAIKAQKPEQEDAVCPRYYVGLDVASRKTQICILDDKGKLFLEKELKTHPAAIADYLRKHCASRIETVALETGGMSSWIYHGLRKSRIPVVGVAIPILSISGWNTCCCRS
jgi:predicted NBD/HSP70 family sugar kinase